MTRQEILTAIKPYFDIEELVCDHTYAKWKEQAWQFLDTDYLHALLVIRRDILKKPMWCNSSTKHQRGLRCNRCQMVQEKARQHIKRNADLLPCNIRMEKAVSWLHFDVLPQYGVTEKVYEFNG